MWWVGAVIKTCVCNKNGRAIDAYSNWVYDSWGSDTWIVNDIFLYQVHVDYHTRYGK